MMQRCRDAEMQKDFKMEKTLDYYRENQEAWSDFDYDEKSDNSDINCRRYRILLELQYDWQERDHALIRYLLEEEIKNEEANRYDGWNIFESYDLASFLLLKFKDPSDIPLFYKAKHANFDKGCGYDREHFYLALREKTDAYLEENYPEIFSDVAGDYEEHEYGERLDKWWQYRLASYPSNKNEVSLYTQFQDAILLRDKKRAKELLVQWDQETEESREKLELLNRAYVDLEEHEKVFELSKKLRSNEEKSLWDKASELRDFIVLATKAKAYEEALEYAKELALVFEQTTEWHDIGLGRMAKEEVFNLAKSTENQIVANDAFQIAHKWHEENSDMSWSGLESAWKSAEHCGLEKEKEYYKALADAERRRIDKM